MTNIIHGLNYPSNYPSLKLIHTSIPNKRLQETPITLNPQREMLLSFRETEKRLEAFDY